MWRVKMSVIAAVLTCMEMTAYPQNINLIKEFMGASEVEEMNPYDVERLENLLEHPLKLNHVSLSKLEESGLLSRYQMASLSDYRARHGDVLSFNELAVVDGFSHDFVSRLAPFVSLESGRQPGAAAGSSIDNDISVRTSLKSNSSITYGMKYKLAVGERITGGLSVSRTSDAAAMEPDAFSGHLAFHFMRRPGKIVLGDFNARFGQGLALWNGMSFSGLTSASSFMRKASGISAASSFTGRYSLRGVAAEVSFGHFKVAALTSVAGTCDSYQILPAANLSWFMSNGLVSLTHYADFSLDSVSAVIPDMKTSADVAFCFSGIDFFAETAFDWVAVRAAALAGVSIPAGDDVRLAAMLRYYPSGYTPSRSAAARSTTKCTNEYAFSMAADYWAGRWVTLNGSTGFGTSSRRISGKSSADFAYFPETKSKDRSVKSIQIKVQTEFSWLISPSFKVSARIAERIRTWGDRFRTDVRTDLSYISDRFLATLRINALTCVGFGLLGYLEGGYRTDRLGFFLRAGFFGIDNWADRIYAYERDAPGSFNVPAYYGRGAWIAVNVNWRFAVWGRMYLRAASTSYPFMAEKKPGRAELKFQMVFTF